MNSKRHCHSFIDRKRIALLASVVLMVSAAADMALAKTAKEIDASVNACLDRFYNRLDSKSAGRPKTSSFCS